MNYFRCGGGRSTHTAIKIDVAKTPLATFESNVSGLYLPEIIAYIQATQSGSGDPSPSNPRAINGVSSVDTTVCGKNLFDKSNANVVSGYIGTTFTDSNTKAKTVYISIPSGCTLTVSKIVSARFTIATSPNLPTNGSAYTNRNVLNSASYLSITAGNTDRYLWIWCYLEDTDTVTLQQVLDSLQVELGNTATTYHAYTGTTATTSLGGTYYGGYLNVTTGVLTVLYEKYKLPSTGWAYSLNRYQNTDVFPAGEYYADTNVMCDTYPKITLAQAGNGRKGVVMGYNSSYIYFYITEDFPTLSDWTTYLTNNDVYITRPLATPQTYQLTPAQIEQLLGQNNVFCSTGDVAVKGWKID